MPYPAFAPGQTVTAAMLLAMQPVYAVKAVTEALPSSTSFQADDELTLPVLADAVYEAVFVLYPSGNPIGTGGIKTMWSVPSGTTGLKACVGGVGADRNSTLMRASAHNLGTQVTYNLESAAAASAVVERSIMTVGGTAGNLTLQWAQVASNATATNILASSYLRLQRLA